MIVVVAPGQGSQTPGFLTPWLEQPGLAEKLAGYSDAAELDLAEHGTVSDADTIRDTRIAQPLIVAAGLLTLSALFDPADGEPAQAPAGFAGHSVGEITAAAGAGVLTGLDAMRLVGARGRAMAGAASLADTGMSAVVGGDEQTVLARLAEVGLSPANYNGGGQIVVAGPRSALAELAAEPPAGSRVIALQVAGAFHTDYMATAVDAVREVAADLTTADPRFTIWTNRDGTEVQGGSEFLDLLVGQISSPVRWDLTMASFAEAGVTGIIELAPAGALVGLAKRGLRGVPSVAVKTPDDLQAARDLLATETSGAA
ncbi:ACP S-malonyltransferase [Amnibacterium flavum]|uniref:[acyl-carrier-protein] S-malonyltransferase n=1 Tax=Amnibacterium flavum TaxID=2173173 RepID=A0A2V1HT30_9MICO|nr:ACP S-malonyltransferase [Amnibacterium flavum]PVZ94209.1 ACP S-malonyltransferase [Amnibacterium flavum]